MLRIAGALGPQPGMWPATVRYVRQAIIRLQGDVQVAFSISPLGMALPQAACVPEVL